jgi:Flp pilus assembly pilin Flp
MDSPHTTDPVEDGAPEPSQAGQGMVEYALIIVLVAIGALIALQVLGHATNNLYSNITTNFGP